MCRVPSFKDFLFETALIKNQVIRYDTSLVKPARSKMNFMRAKLLPAVVLVTRIGISFAALNRTHNVTGGEQDSGTARYLVHM
jgi:hypothetical protein